MEFRIEQRDSIALTGLPLRTRMDGTQFAEIPAFWQASMDDGRFERLIKSAGPGSLGVVGVSGLDIDPVTQEFTYLIGIESPTDRSALPEGCVDRAAPPATWAVFEARGPLPGSVQDVFKGVYEGAWFQTSGYARADGPEIEVYPPGDSTAAAYRAEVWIPVVKS